MTYPDDQEGDDVLSLVDLDVTNHLRHIGRRSIVINNAKNPMKSTAQAELQYPVLATPITIPNMVLARQGKASIFHIRQTTSGNCLIQVT
jgi:hypothetical protein